MSCDILSTRTPLSGRLSSVAADAKHEGPQFPFAFETSKVRRLEVLVEGDLLVNGKEK